MRNKVRLLAVALAAGGTMFAQSRLSIGIGVGGYGPGYCPPPAYTQRYAPVNNYRTAPRYVDQREDKSFSDRDRDRDRGHENQYQSRGSERFDSRNSFRTDNHDSDHSSNHGSAYSNNFRR